ncbi:hypothetical protein [Aequorivita echinoideorum]|uniref:Secreted protein n=1 Tax=Aequorivita echinoideorum TaxID=1549647 RepID=A0ABS5S9R6_9FLAO|nr:hypothetical protein [Aequorivita echinoideorum]MBT0609180.1 hypothetical protein [Aequorivita echinoideorum]
MYVFFLGSFWLWVVGCDAHERDARASGGKTRDSRRNPKPAVPCYGGTASFGSWDGIFASSGRHLLSVGTASFD